MGQLASDIRVIFDGVNLTGDLDFVSGQLALEHGLESAIIISIFSDQRSPDDIELPLGETNRRGVWFDGLGEDSDDKFGSLFWLLDGEKQTEATRLKAISYVTAALQWLIRDEVARQVDVDAEWLRDGFLALRIAIHRPTGSVERFQVHWRAMETN